MSEMGIKHDHSSGIGASNTTTTIMKSNSSSSTPDVLIPQSSSTPAASSEQQQQHPPSQPQPSTAQTLGLRVMVRRGVRIERSKELQIPVSLNTVKKLREKEEEEDK